MMTSKRSKFLRDGAALLGVAGMSGQGMNISISIPDDDGLGLNGTVPITVLVQPQGNLRYVRITIDGNVVSEDVSSPYEYQWDTTQAADGTHIIAAVAQYKTRKSQAQVAVTVNNAPPPPPPPPPPDGLFHPAPTLTDPITLTIPSVGSLAGDSFPLQAGRDYIIQFTNGYREGGLRFQGAARHLVMKKCEQVITNTTSTDYGARRLLEFRDITGIIHIEGYYGHGVSAPSLTEGINIQCPQATLQIQNSRIEGVKRMNANADPQHPDVIQTWSLKTLRLWNFTCSSDYQGFLTMAIAGQVYPGTNGGEVHYHRVNCHVLPNAFTGGLQNVPFVFPLQKAQRFVIGDFYVAGAYIGGQPAGVANSIYERANDPFLNGAPTLWDYQLFRADGTAYQAPQTGKTTATWLGDMLTVNQDDYIQFINPTLDNIWNLTATGGARVKKGVPAGGDYQPAATTGRNYPG